jgi:hydroxymethylpyrimidine/phosphomethylpyrimidine kinase
MSTPTVIAVGGLDDGATAGLTRDAQTALALGVDCRLVGTAWTRQLGTPEQGGFETRDRREVGRHLSLLLQSVTSNPIAIKVGMVATPGVAAEIADCLQQPEWSHLPVVFDPVLATSSGLSLFQKDGDVLMALRPLIRRATVLTPNRTELGVLTGQSVENTGQAAAAARALVLAGAQAVLAKGGHFEGPAIDQLCRNESTLCFVRDRIAGRDPRGTGCALATAIAVSLARGEKLEHACRSAGDWLGTQIAMSVQRGGSWHLP